MKYKILIVGHAGYPSGVATMLEFVAGIENVDFFNLDHENGFDKMKQDLKIYLQENPQTLVFADIPGGSPHRFVIELITKMQLYETLVIAGASPALMMDLAFQFKLFEIPTLADAKTKVAEKTAILSKYTLTFMLD